MWQSHKLVVQSTDQPCFGAFQALAAAAADHRRRSYRLILGSMAVRRTSQVQGFVFSSKCLWLSQYGVYIYMPAHLAKVAGLRWLSFSKDPLVRSGMTLEAIASIRYVRIHWGRHKSVWEVSFLFPRQTATPKRSRVYFPFDQNQIERRTL